VLAVSDLMAGQMQQALPAAQFMGSVNALAMLRSGTAEVAIVAIPDGKALPEQFECIPFAYEVASVVVNDTNPLRKISLHSLTSIYSRTNNSIEKWGALGLTEGWATRSISAHMPDNSSGITAHLFVSMTLVNTPVSDSVGRFQTQTQVEAIASSQPSCLIIMRGVNVPPGARALEVSRTSAQDDYAYPPTQDSIFFGDYPLRLPFYIVIPKDAPQATRATVAKLLGDDIAAALEKAGFVPVPASERHRD
jgi:ABC-type phosphate transport system substrate-binding protein